MTGSTNFSLNRYQPPGGERVWFEHVIAHALATPDLPAITDATGSHSYADMVKGAFRIGHALLEAGAEKESIVALLLPRSASFAMAFIGAGWAGCAVMPLDPLAPVKRHQRMLTSARPHFIITSQDFRDRIPPALEGARCLDVDELLGDASLDARQLQPPSVGLGDLAYVFFTSGSTGEPKGVMMTHRPTRPLTEDRRELQLGEMILARASLGFTLMLREILWPLHQGGHVLMVEAEYENDLDWLVETIRRNRIRKLHFSPSFLALFLEHPEVTQCSSVEKIYTVGESFSPSIQQQCFAIFPQVQLFDFYGCTEAPALCLREIRAEDLGTKKVLLGKELSPQKIYLLDDSLRPVPDGETGEIFGAGHLARGYLHDPELTARRFLPDPFSTAVGARMYRTGDLARRLPDGRLEFLGRRDHQIQVGGARVELNEIAEELMLHPDINRAVVLSTFQAGRSVLSAFIQFIPNRSPPPTSHDLHAYLLERLPSYMIPARFISVESFPLNLNGKIDFPELQRLQDSSLPGMPSADFVLPSSAVEIRLAEIFCRILDRKQVSIHDNFFLLGGDSLSAIRAVSQINRAFRTALAPPLLHRCPSIAELAQHIRSETPVVGTRRFYHARSGTRPIPLCLINFEADFLNDHLADRSVHMAPALFGDSAYNYRTSIADYAADYATDLQLMQFDQPPTLIGFSIGGLVAYEAARQLRDMGHPPGRLILVEPVTPLWQGPVPKRRSTWAAYRLARHYEGKGGMAVRALMAALLTKWNRPVGEALRKAAAMAYISLTVEAESLAPYKGELTLIGTPFFEEIELPLWQRALAQPPRFIRVTGCDHFGLVKPPFSAQWLQHID